ncbi:hypothetical protein O3P69_010250 [Scylla paramamosain]|uniref:Mariner Mos1 transposase n=1 Tax=Scylla paramamosain TaxID=85552 RepID=A0AAW0TS91_SCYPA
MEILNKWDENYEAFLQRIVTGNETWLYQYDPDNKIQSKQWPPRGRSKPVKAKSECSRGKVMAIVFWDAEEKRPGKLHQHFLFHHDMHLLTALGRQELCYVNFDEKSSDIPLTAPI